MNVDVSLFNASPQICTSLARRLSMGVRRLSTPCFHTSRRLLRPHQHPWKTMLPQLPGPHRRPCRGMPGFPASRRYKCDCS